MPKTLRSILSHSFVGDIVRATRRSYWPIRSFYRKVTGIDKRIVKRYLARDGARKLHIGCGEHPIEGWLNTDYFPTLDNTVFLDATKTFPFADGTFDYIYSEHMIEHISYPMGQVMLRECFRVLKEGGKIRITTPDLAFVIALYGTDKSELQQRYIKVASEGVREIVPSCEETFVINNFVRDWGHTFIYDQRVLRACVERAGFKEITNYNLNQSGDEDLRHLENEGRMQEGFLQLESFTLEGTKRVRA